MAQFLSPESVIIDNAVATFPKSNKFTWADTSNPSYTVDTVDASVIHVTNFQGTQKQLEELSLGAFVELTEKKIYRINAVKYENSDGSGNKVMFFLNRACTGAGGDFQVVTIKQCGVEKSVMVRLESGTALVKNVNNDDVSTLTVANQRLTWNPQNPRGWVETIMVDTTGGGQAEASNSN